MIQQLVRWMGIVALLLSGCGRGGVDSANPNGSNLLLGRAPLSARGVANADRLTDGDAARHGDYWASHLTSQFKGSKPFAVYDLGKTTPIAGLWLQGDNNDDYIVEVSNDGEHFEPLWVAAPTPGTGLQDRAEKGLSSSGRYLRISAEGGDSSYALSEVQAFAEAPSTFPPEVPRKRGFRVEVKMRTQILLFGLAMALFVLVTYRGARWWWVAVASVAPLITGFDAVTSIAAGLPVDQRTVSLVRGTIGLVAAITIAREAFGPQRFLAHRGAVLAILATCGVLGVLSFYNLGAPQFHDHELKEPTYVHHLDLRQYYATAKYFPEIGYRELYAADVAAYLEDNPHLTLEGIRNQNMRDLSDHRVSTVGAQRERILAVKSRFTPERWEAYKTDQRYFRGAMTTPRYFEFMNDLGGNATPVWISIGYLMFNVIDATNTSFLMTGMADPLMLVIALIAIGVVFGPRTAFACAVLFGANDLIMYSSNWGGATLRHDWMAYLAFGACALRRERWMLGGMFLALATLIRAFPALSLLALGIPLLWQVLESLWHARRLPSLADVTKQQRWFLHVALGAAITGLLAITASSLILGIASWPEWYAKVSQLTADPHASHISLRTLLSGSEFDHKEVMRARWPLVAVAYVFYIGGVVIGGRGKRPEQIAMLGMTLLPVLLYPANYYLHFLWLLPMTVIERPSEERPLNMAGAGTWLCLLLLCAVQYWTTLVPDQSLHFYLGTVCLFGALTALTVVYARQGLRDVATIAMQPRNVTDADPTS